MKKRSIMIGLVVAVCLATTTVFAKVTTLWRATDTTYVLSEHQSGLHWMYYGTASVRGADRTMDEHGHLAYYKWTQITYDVQGEFSSIRAVSLGPDDTMQRISRVTARDKSNDGPKTRALYNYETAPVEHIPYHIEDTYFGVRGGVLREGEVIQCGKVVTQGIPRRE